MKLEELAVEISTAKAAITDPCRLLPHMETSVTIRYPRQRVDCVEEGGGIDCYGQYHLVIIEDDNNPGKAHYRKMYSDGHLGAVED